MSLISRNSSETPSTSATDEQKKTCAETLIARLKTLGVEVETGCNSATSVAYAANGLILRQKETVSTTEYRGLDKEAAKLLEALDSDDTTTTVYYKTISENTDYAAVAVTTGTKTDYVPTREDEGDAWKVTKTVSTYAAASDTGWSTTVPSAASDGIVVTKSKQKTFIAYSAGTPIFQNVETVVMEYPFLSYGDAVTKVSQSAASGSIVYDEEIVTSWSTSGGITGTKNITVRGGSGGSTTRGTDKVPTMRYDGPERRWVVTVTETTYWGSSS